MTEAELTITVVIDPAPLAALLQESSPRAILPTLSYGRVRIGYSRRMREELERELAAGGLAPPRVRELLEELRRQGEELEPGRGVEAYEDGARDEGLRLAIAFRPAIYLTADAGLLELGEWKEVDLAGDIEEVRAALLTYEDTAVVFRARSEPEALRVQEALQEGGVEARVVSQQVPWYDGVLLLGQGYWGDVVIFEKDTAEAERIIKDLDV